MNEEALDSSLTVTAEAEVAILLSPRVSIDVSQIKPCAEGRSIILKTTYNGVQLTLGCMYGPNDDTVAPFERFLDGCEELWGDYVILGGDFSFYFNENLDKQSQRKNRRNNTRCKQLVAQFMLENDLIDIWRVLNPNDKQFTCHIDQTHIANQG